MNRRAAIAMFVAVAACSGSGGAVPDAAPASADAPTTTLATSPCTVTAAQVVCPHAIAQVSDSLVDREVAYALPLGTPPAAGWPVALLFQGSFVAGDGMFAQTTWSPFGGYDLALTISELLAHGYAVIAPDAAASGDTFWETNVPPYADSWSGAPDDVMMHNLLAAIASGELGALDATRLYATGISSGGFMTSRMAVSYPGQFRALADVAGSYATCSALCTVPTPLPADHPPILFLHGALDPIVPTTAITPYVDALAAQGLTHAEITDGSAGHQWIAAGVTAIPAWFDAH